MASMKMGAFFLVGAVGVLAGLLGPGAMRSVAGFSAGRTEAEATLFTGVLGSSVALLAIAIAVWGVISQRALSRKQVTFEQLARSEADGSFQAALRTFNAESRTEDGLAPWALKEREGTAEQKHIVTILNDFELFSIGIQRGIIDGALYKQLNRGAVLYAWDNAQPFIAALRRRTGNDKLYYEFEEMARWMRENRLPKRTFWWTGLA